MRALAMMLVLAAAGLPWTKAKDDGTTKVEYRDHLDKNAREVRAETVIDAPPEKVWDVVADMAHQAEFMPYLGEARAVGPCDGGGTLYYERITPPIISARDYTVCVRLVAEVAARHYERAWTLANDKGPAPRDGTVRVPVNEGSYDVSPDGKGGTRLVYTVLTNPGGSIPGWIARHASTTSVTDVLDAVRHRVRDPRWKR